LTAVDIDLKEVRVVGDEERALREANYDLEDVERHEGWYRMAHYRKSLAAAAALNTAIFVVEAVAGFKADSLSLVMDSVHNLSDEMALVFLYLAFILPHGISRHSRRAATMRRSGSPTFTISATCTCRWRRSPRACLSA
jgi:hypothetical protein